MIRALFIEPMMTSTLDGTSGLDVEASQIIENLAVAVMNPGAVIGPPISQTSKLLDDIAMATPVTARVLMAYVSGMQLSLLCPFVIFTKTGHQS